MHTWGCFSAALGLVILLIVTGCNYTQRLTVNRLPPLPDHTKMPLRVVLLLEDQTCDFTYKVNQSRSMRVWIYRMGKTLCAYSEAVTREVFAEVAVVTWTNEAAARMLAGQADVVIIPRVLGVLVDFPDFPQSIWEKQKVEIILDWLFVDAEEQVIRSQTDGGTAEKRAGTALGRARLNRQAMQAAIDAAFITMRDRLLTSPELRDFVATRR